MIAMPSDLSVNVRMNLSLNVEIKEAYVPHVVTGIPCARLVDSPHESGPLT